MIITYIYILLSLSLSLLLLLYYDIYIYYTIVVGITSQLMRIYYHGEKATFRSSQLPGMGQFHESTSKAASCATSAPLAFFPWQSALCATTSDMRCCVDKNVRDFNGIYSDLMGFYGILWWFYGISWDFMVV